MSGHLTKQHSDRENVDDVIGLLL